MSQGAKLEFWFDFASTYSYLSAMRIGALGAKASVEIVWLPFLLGPIFKAQGWDNSPFNLYPVKGQYMWRDVGRLAAERSLVFQRPGQFPQNGLTAARLGVVGKDAPWLPDFCRAVFAAEFSQGLDISSDRVLSAVLENLDLDPAELLARAREQDVKQRLRRRTERAAENEIFGAPSFIAENELFWGDDRLEQALEYALGNRN